MSLASKAGKIIRGPYQGWGIEVAMRYLPVAKIAKKAGLDNDITEIGSGTYGITPYLKKPITGVDMNFFEGQAPLLRQVKGSVLDIPFKDSERACVISVDMLEHIPSGLRPKAIDELVRISRKLLIIAFPYGDASEKQDRELALHYRELHGEDYLFFTEHLELGLPKEVEVKRWVNESLSRHGRLAKVNYLPNSNLKVRRWLMRLWINDKPFNKLAWILLNYFHPIFTRLNNPPCYRLIVSIQFDDAT